MNKKILRVSLVGLMILFLGLLASSLTPITPSGTTPCKESNPACSNKNGEGNRNDIDIETLSGKFFSSVSY